ncbi:MAG: immunoglobulin domain-containing protein, partial [Opitutaceae bacterium]
MVSTSGTNVPEIRSKVGDMGSLEFAYASIPASSAAFTVVVSHPAGMSGNQTIRGSGLYRSPLRNLSVPDVVLVSEASPPVITRQPSGTSVAAGQSVALSVEVSGSPVISYQWRRDGVALAGATSATLNLGAVSAGSAGSYDVMVANSAGHVASRPATVSVPAAAVAPAITAQPVSLTVTPGSAATFAVTATGSAPLVYEWRRDGVAVPGATEATLFLPAVYATSAGGFSVVVSNSAGSVTSSSATLTVSSAAVSPVITTQPASQSVAAGGSATLSVVATGTAPLAYQWRKDGAAIAGATRDSYALSSFTAAAAGSYSVVVSNSAGSVTSSPAVVSLAASTGLSGAVFGTFAGDAGSFALWVRADRTAVFLGFLRSGGRALLNRTAEIGADGRFQFSLESSPSGGAVTGVSGVLSVDGSVNGTLAGAGIAISAPARTASSATSALAGYYAAGEPNGSSVAHTIVGAGGESYVLIVANSGIEAGRGTAGADGAITVATGSSTVAGSVQRENATVVLASQRPSGSPASFVGANDERRTVREKLLNISTRSDTTGAEGNALIAGFVIGGSTPKRVLVRAIGPSLAPFGVTGALPAARLELFRGQTSLAVSNDWGSASGASSVAAAAARLGAFALDAASRDAAVLIELAPGAYTAVMTGQGSAGGVGLVEVYDADETALAAQRIGNLASRGLAGSGDRTLTVGFVVGGTVPKRVLVRGVGPALTAFGVTGALADPRLEV